VYDPVHHKTLLFGGQSPNGALLNDVWEFDAATATWTDVTPPAGALAPSPRARFGMAVDANRNVAVVYGGFIGGSPGTNNETWEWDFATRSWSLRGPGIFDYAGRIGAEMAYDPNLRQVILFGGVPYWVWPTNGGTYAWDGSAWREVSSAGPGGRVAHAMVTDPVRSTVVM
jgi:hypothetical protein